jgi:Nif-specific regulatory protein
MAETHDPSGRPAGRAAEMLRQASSDLQAASLALGRQTAPPSPSPRHEDELRGLMRLARQVTSILELQPLLEAVVSAFVSITEAERGFLMLYDPDGVLQFRAAHNLDAESVQHRSFEISRGPIQEAASSGRSVFVDDVLTQGEYGARDSVLALKLRSFSVVPLVHGGRVLGVCYTDSRQPGKTLGTGDRTLLESFASQAGLAIDNARRHGELLQAKSRLEAENEDLRRQIERKYRFNNILGSSAAMQRLFDTLEKVAATAVNVLLQGETGTGKELIARALHCNGPLRDASFVTVNAGALPEHLLESELFGHKRGAFTSSIEDRKGLFEEADGGTLFLDEIGEMPLALQPKLLRALQEGEIRRVGDSAVRHVRVRVIAATNRDLAGEVRAGRFREDLFYRLNVVGIQIPPLRERGNDILVLAEEFVTRFAKQHSKQVAGLSAAAGRWLLSQRWEGNVRELQNCIERAVTLCENGVSLDVESLQAPWMVSDGRPRTSAATLKETLEMVEKEEVMKALEATGGRVTLAAHSLGISRQHLHNLMNKHQVTAKKK